ncbi:hypothetical protein ABDD95_07475 [Mucilaginibacter sp. PAMB04274]|uniref:hypothetical protein n=1 Tax=Mucilaginibacter sp. PAMB04274 TaxID=3138568 RepID=UPI0031F6D63E
MKKISMILLMNLWWLTQAFAQMTIRDEAIRYQEERMVFKQWDQNKFKPGSGFLGLSPYYWLTWGLMPGYKKTDLRPLGPSGPQTQRLALVSTMNSTDNSYKLHADTLRNSALSEIANQQGMLSGADPLWLLFYSKELRPVLDHSEATILGSLPAAIRSQVVSEGIYNWYSRELDMLKERLDAARSTDMDRGSRIMAYHRMLLEYRVLAATWATRTATAVLNRQMTDGQSRATSGQVTIGNWSPATDIQIANRVLADRKY